MYVITISTYSKKETIFQSIYVCYNYVRHLIYMYPQNDHIKKGTHYHFLLLTTYQNSLVSMKRYFQQIYRQLILANESILNQSQRSILHRKRACPSPSMISEKQREKVEIESINLEINESSYSNVTYMKMVLFFSLYILKCICYPFYANLNHQFQFSVKTVQPKRA